MKVRLRFWVAQEVGRFFLQRDLRAASDMGIWAVGERIVGFSDSICRGFVEVGLR